ncbi:hypothetical protein BN946_scf184851.g100 [Trametes cinnabarina]|uniref:Uncharacterized protein n=1 Tax=Pycnoporus cinnabarinus TaxID=5643 RepID=A0A060S5J5_PYCCI|nr:hypothetical protein BN946_scf184851.g100 [Trametes cinnabarina]
MNVIGALPTDPYERHMSMQLLLLVDYRRQPQIVAQAFTVLDSRTENHLLLELERHAEAMGATKLQFERATRCLSGRATLEGRPCSEGALLFMEPLISRWRKRFSKNVIFGDMPPSSVPPEASCVMAHAVAAYAYFEKYSAASEDFPRILQDAKDYPRPTGQKDLLDRVDNMLHAIRHATFAASM